MKNIILIFSIIIFYCSSVNAQYPTLLKDINTAGNYDIPKLYCNVNNIIFFSHDDGVHGTELWRTDGTVAGTYMVKDIIVGYEGSLRQVYNSKLVSFNGLVFFMIKNENQGFELWKSDGTEVGTVLVKVISTGNVYSYPKLLTDCGNFLIFSANDGTNGAELWKSDGTTAGTSMISNLSTGAAGTEIYEIVYAPALFNASIYVSLQKSGESFTHIYSMSYSIFGGSLGSPTLLANSDYANSLYYTFSGFKLYFRGGTSNVNNNDFKVYNGASITTLKAFTNPPYFNYYNNNKIQEYNGNVYFTIKKGDGSNINSHYELWKSDGTIANTTLVKAFNDYPNNFDNDPMNFTVVNNLLFFVLNDGVTGRELWKTDGTTIGTVLVSDIVAGAVGSNPANLLVNGTKLYFETFPPTINNDTYQVRVFDTSNSQLTLLKDFTPIPNIEENLDFAILDQNLIFTGYDNAHAFEVWKSDGTVAGTAIIKDISQGNSYSAGFLSVNANTFFGSVEDANEFLKPFVSNGTTAGTFRLADIRVNYPFYTNQIFTNINGTLFFEAYEPTNGYELWKTNGTIAGTVLLKDINPGANSSSPSSFCNANGTLFFSASDNINGNELWKSDGTVAGTVLVKDITIGTDDSEPRNLIYMNGFVYFSANYNELWKSDGTSAGTTLIKTFSNSISNEQFMVFNNKVYFVANDGVSGEELWATDGTLAGTTVLKDIYAGATGSFPQNLTTNGIFSKFYFTADNGINGRELWVSDGTLAGTILINICPEIPSFPTAIAQGSSPQSLTFVGNLLLFSAYKYDFSGDKFGRELWRSGATVSSTTLVKDINLAVGVGGISSHTNEKFPTVGGYIYFPANDGTNGIELWKSNGAITIAMVSDLFLGNYNDGVAPYSTMHANNNSGRVFFEATNGQNGRELWSFQFCPTTLNINTTVQAQNQKQQASSILTSSSNIANTNYLHYDLTVQYQAGNVIDLQPGFFVKAGNIPLSVPNPMTFFRADIGGCN
jgi:ELWxxDGT repeat protein